MRTVITAVDVLQEKGYSLDEEKVHYALAHVKEINGLYGRWDVINRNPLTVVDVAHNEDGIKLLLSQLVMCNYKNLHIVFGIVKDKEVSTILSILPKKATYYFTKAQIARALPEVQLMEKASEYNLYGTHFPEVNMALTAARNNAGKDDMILVCGSVYVAGEVNVNFKREL
jgi:dihydrofolate synthase/folylpolyglutamate synthase